MSDAVILALIALVGTTITSTITAFVYIKLGRVETKVDGKMTELIRVVEGKAVAQIGQAAAESFTAGEQAQRDRTAEPEK